MFATPSDTTQRSRRDGVPPQQCLRCVFACRWPGFSLHLVSCVSLLSNVLFVHAVARQLRQLFNAKQIMTHCFFSPNTSFDPPLCICVPFNVTDGTPHMFIKFSVFNGGYCKNNGLLVCNTVLNRLPEPNCHLEDGGSKFLRIVRKKIRRVAGF
jgi:hypothetical protein